MSLTARCRAALTPGWTGTAADLAELIGVNNPNKVAHVLEHLAQRGEVLKAGLTPPGPKPFDKGLRIWAARSPALTPPAAKPARAKKSGGRSVAGRTRAG